MQHLLQIYLKHIKFQDQQLYKAITHVKSKAYLRQIDSTNKRFKCLKYGIKRLAKIELKIENAWTIFNFSTCSKTLQ